jgi:protein-tyrosine phosphatase
MEIHLVHPEGLLFVSGDIDDWEMVKSYCIDTIIDLDGGIDDGVPEVPNEVLYVYFPILDNDDALPSPARLDAVGRFIANLVDTEHIVLIHCLLGLNRSNLVAAMALTYLGMTGTAAVEHLQEIQPAALYNETFAAFVRGLPARRVRVEHL